jgi:anti-sigma regulatory factor (Ser/Thr protein kinase)
VRDLSLHILDIAENSINAGARNIEIEIDENIKKDLLMIKISDDGIGMDAEMKEKVTDPFVTSRTTRKVGLGLPLLKLAAEIANGKLIIESVKAKGTKITATFQLSHIDRKPLGKVSDTILTLVAGNPEVGIKFRHKRNGYEFDFSSLEFIEKVRSEGLNSTEILLMVKRHLNEYSKKIKT